MDNSTASLVIRLAEAVTVDSILIRNHEEFSDNLKKIEYFGNKDYPPKEGKPWIKLGSVYPNSSGEK